jgi:hypothetical protein
MPDATVRANAQAMPIDRRVALGSIAAAGAVMLAPSAALAASPDAELFALARKAKALGVECKAAADAVREIEDRLREIPIPPELRITDLDATQFPVAKNRAGVPFTPHDVEALRANRQAVLRICRVLEECDAAFVAEAEWRVARIVEIERVRERYDAEQRAISEGAGLSEAEARYDRISGELFHLCGVIAFTPAQTVEGVLTKLGVAMAVPGAEPIDPKNYPDGCSDEQVAWMAACDLAALRLTEA